MITRRRRSLPGMLLSRDLDREVRTAEPCMCGALDCLACRGSAAEVPEMDEIEIEPDDDRPRGGW